MTSWSGRDFFAIVTAFVVVFCVIVLHQDRGRFDRLNARVTCLEHPHGESSTAGRLVGKPPHRRFVVTQPPTRTGCP